MSQALGSSVGEGCLLSAGLPLSGKIEPILTETIFSQMMRVPYPHLKPIAYATILVSPARRIVVEQHCSADLET